MARARQFQSLPRARVLPGSRALPGLPVAEQDRNPKPNPKQKTATMLLRALLALAVTTTATVLLTGRPHAAAAHEASWLKTDLHRAAWYGLMPLVTEEIAKGTDVNLKDDMGRTALHFAAYKGRISTTPVEDRAARKQDKGNYKTAAMVEALIEAGADVNAVDDDGSTPLLEAVPNGNIEIVEILLKAGAKRDVQNRHGDTPASTAQRRKHPEIEQMLLKGEL